MRTAIILTLASVSTLAGCMSAAERADRERAADARSVSEICTLPPAEREAALERLKEKSGLVLVCGSP